MTNRDWLCLTLRLFGVWLLIQAAERISSSVWMYLSGAFFGGTPDFEWIVVEIVWPTVRTTFALILVFFAPAIAIRFHSAEQIKETNPPEFNETRALKIGIQLLAVYALLLAVQSGSDVIFTIVSRNSFPNLGFGRHYLHSLLTCGLNLVFAVGLIIWNAQIIRGIEKFRYVAERDAYEPPSREE